MSLYIEVVQWFEDEKSIQSAQQYMDVVCWNWYECKCCCYWQWEKYVCMVWVLTSSGRTSLDDTCMYDVTKWQTLVIGHNQMMHVYGILNGNCVYVWCKWWPLVVGHDQMTFKMSYVLSFFKWFSEGVSGNKLWITVHLTSNFIYRYKYD